MKIPSEIIKTIEANKKELEFLPTGFKKIDNFLNGGFLKKELIVLGAPTGKGKSYIAGHIFNHVARQGFKSAYFSLEISNEMVLSRLLGEETKISATKIMTGQVVLEEELERLIEAKSSLVAHDELMFFYDDIYILAMLEKEIKERQYDFVVVDFIQNVVASGEEYERLSHISLQLQMLAKEANCCILVLSQLSNMVSREKRDDIVEYRGSGTIATVCDLGFFIETEKGQDDNSNSLTIKLRKNRRGVSGKAFEFYFRNGQIFEA